MPGPVTDAYDPEWGTADNADRVRAMLTHVYGRVSGVLSGRGPMYVLDLERAELPTPITATLTEKEWRTIRFALERAGDSV